MDEARRGLLYDVPPALSQHQKSGHGQALENMGTEEMRKKPPEVRHMNTRRLGLVGHGETELWEGDHKAFIVFGKPSVKASLRKPESDADVTSLEG